MKLSLAFATLSFFFATSAWAVDPNQCPVTLAVRLSNTSIYQNSVSQKVPGWMEAQQQLLKTNLQGTWKLSLLEKRNEACLYGNNRGATAYLFSTILNDPEIPEKDRRATNLLSLRFPFVKWQLSALVLVAKYTPTSIELAFAHANSKSRLRVRLPHLQDPAKLFDYDIGDTRIDASTF